jgi:hypothetical protein
VSRFDLSDPADFSRITQQSLSDTATNFGIDSPRDWNIREGSYNGVRFHVFKTKTPWQGGLESVSDTIGRRKVKYEFPYRDGQTTDDLGQSAGTFVMQVLIHGPRYRQGLDALRKEINKPTAGTLVHPIYGELTCVIETVELLHKSTDRRAVALEITFSEHSFDIGDVGEEIEESSLKSALTTALNVFSVIDGVINKVEAAEIFVRAVKDRINSLARTLKSDTAKTLTGINTSLNTKGGSQDIPNLLPTDQGGTRNTDGSVSSETFVSVRSVSDPFNDVPISELPPQTTAALAVPDLERSVIDVREQIATLISQFETEGAELDFFDEIVSLRESANQIQLALEAGVASSNAVIVDYEIPRVMSLREAGWINGVKPDRFSELFYLNSELDSVNYLEPGTSVRIPA